MIDYIVLDCGFVFGYVGVVVNMIFKNELIFYLYQEEKILPVFFLKNFGDDSSEGGIGPHFNL